MGDDVFCRSVLRRVSKGDVLSQRKSRILVIDDNEADVFLLKEALRREHLDCELVALRDGTEGVAFLREGGVAANPPDCILLDINLPGIEGDQVLKAIREHSCATATPVLVWSSHCPQPETLRDPAKRTFFFKKSPRLREFLKIGTTIRALLEKVTPEPRTAASSTPS